MVKVVQGTSKNTRRTEFKITHRTDNYVLSEPVIDTYISIMARKQELENGKPQDGLKPSLAIHAKLSVETLQTRENRKLKWHVNYLKKSSYCFQFALEVHSHTDNTTKGCSCNGIERNQEQVNH